ncbi:MAG: hypothetical protein LBL41_03790 [Bifidobacteriaceae bacterium]|jgi:hypothetical protein|nr:hypothetical protein [Bifidobacteriaceae bacterium]
MITVLLVTVAVYGILQAEEIYGFIESARLKRLVRKNDDSVRIGQALILELMLQSIKSGASIQYAMQGIGQSALSIAPTSKIAVDVQAVGKKLMLGIDWDDAWKGGDSETDMIEECLRHSWNRGASPVRAIETYLDGLGTVLQAKTRLASEKLSVKVIIPLGACFLPSFIMLGVIPIVISLFENM